MNVLSVLYIIGADVSRNIVKISLLRGSDKRKHGRGLVSEKGDTSSVLPCFASCVSYSKFRGKPPSPQGEGFSHCKFNLYCKEF